MPLTTSLPPYPVQDRANPSPQARARVTQIFRYLQALDQLRNPAQRQVKEQVWSLALRDLPQHPNVQCPLRDALLTGAPFPMESPFAPTTRAVNQASAREDEPETETADDIEDSETSSAELDAPAHTDAPVSVGAPHVLRVVRPVLTSPPPLSEPLLGWVQLSVSPFDTPKPIQERKQTPLKGQSEQHAPSHNEAISSRDWALPERKTEEGSAEGRGAQNGRDSGPEIVRQTASSVSFEADPERVTAWTTWKATWEQWAEAERPAQETMRLYERLYALHSQLAREGERFDLVLGDGVLDWARPEGSVHHPLLFQRVELHFDSARNQFTLVEADAPVEFYSALFRGMLDVNGQTIRTLRDQVSAEGISPSGGQATNEYLAGLVSRLDARGEFISTAPSFVALRPSAASRMERASLADGDSLANTSSVTSATASRPSPPRVSREPWLFLRQRTQGFTAALDSILTALDEGADPPFSLHNVVGLETPRHEGDESTASTSPSAASLSDANEDETVLLSKPANEQQLAIARRLEEHGNVLVQGPPGTGKTHTISNLIGHLLAQGKTVLVTSHTTKALRVLRDQVVAPLRPLCVSVLDNDAEGQRHLATAVNAIVERISTASAGELEGQGDRLAAERQALLRDLRETRATLLEARGAEYRDIVLQGAALPPSQAAREVAEGRTAHGWIPGPVAPDRSCPLSPEEVAALYQTNDLLPLHEEEALAYPLPDTTQLLTVEQFRQFIAAEQSLQKVDLATGREFWQPVASRTPNTTQTSTTAQTPAALQALSERASGAMAPLREAAPWQLAALAAGQAGGAEREVWENLIGAIEAVRAQALEAREALLAQGPELASSPTVDEQEPLLAEIVQHLRGGGNLGGLTLLLHRAWRPVLEGARVGGAKPGRLEQFEALQSLAKLTLARRQFAARWERQMVALGAPSAQELGAEPESSATQFVPLLRECLNWWQTTWGPVEAEMSSHGLKWGDLLAQTSVVLANHADLLRLREAVTNVLPDVLTAQLNRLQEQQVARASAEMEGRLQAACAGTGGSLTSQTDATALTKEDMLAGAATLTTGAPEGAAPPALALREAFLTRDGEAYSAGIARVEALRKLQRIQRQRQDLLERLSEVAPAWAQAINYRQSPHDTGAVPGTNGVPATAGVPVNVVQAWRWRQLHDELTRRDALEVPTLEAKVEELGRAVRENTAELIDRRAWAAQVRRTTVPQRQALVGWVQTIRRIGKGTGKRVPQLRAQARLQMNQCRSAVPVWIMPLARVVENFDPRQARFDVVIIDEASQSDVMGLIAFYLGRQVIVVGDDEQVSPEGVGQRAEEVQHLIDEHLSGIPNAGLYDGKFSVYDVAKSSFGGALCLREHFRCVPDIIRFSNYLSYNGDIQPLRDASSVRLQPAVVPYRVRGTEDGNSVNEAEAQTVVSLLVAACEQPEYADATFGVISMVGLAQAERIDLLLRQALPPAEYEKRRIVCGNAAHFQGDEREVMVLSMVNAPHEDGGPLRIQTLPAYQKRLNVAASRARDQMWVVHSLQADVDLKAGDLRRRFLEYAFDPHALQRAHESAEAHVESEFERQVLRRLLAQGYRVTPQWKVGAFRIDLVVEGNGKRLAVECDGDRFHGLDKLPDDMARQALLERLGWKFARIRGSAFFRDPEAAMRPVWEKLQALGIERLGAARSENETGGEAATDETFENGRDQEAGVSLTDKVIERAASLRRQWQTKEQHLEGESLARERVEAD